MGITLGKQMPKVAGADVYDKTGSGHLGIIEFPVPILRGNAEVIKTIREKLYEPEFSFEIAICGAKKKVNKLTGSYQMETVSFCSSK